MSDKREYREAPVYAYSIAQQSWAAAASGAATVTLANMNGICEQIEVKLNNNTNNVTATVAIASALGGTLFSQAGIAENATTVLTALSNKGTQDANFNPFLVDGNLTMTITPSGAPGASGLTVDVTVYLR